MFTKRKLAKLMEKQEDNNKQEINYEILQKAKEETHWNDVGEVRVIDNRKQKIILTTVISCLLILISIGIYLGLTLSKPKNPLDLPIFYSYDEDNIYMYESVEKYMADKNVNLLYFKNYQIEAERVKIYKDVDKDVLLSQEIILDTYERIELNVELKNNYIFDFLTEFDLLKNKYLVNDVQINFNTTFDEEVYAYRTLAKFKYKDYVYKIYFEMEEETDWQNEISLLLE